MSGSQVSIREELLKRTKGPRTKDVTLDDGLEVELRQPSIGTRNELVTKCTDIPKNKKGKNQTPVFNSMDFMVRAIIKCTYVKATGTRVFKNSDYKKLTDSCDAPWLDTLISELSDLLNVSAEDLEKN